MEKTINQIQFEVGRLLDGQGDGQLDISIRRTIRRAIRRTTRLINYRDQLEIS